MNIPAGYRRETPGVHPPCDHRAYASTHKRAPRHELVRIEHTLSEITGPRFARDTRLLSRNPRQNVRQHQLAVRGDSDFRRIILANLPRINIHLNELRVRD